MLFYQTTRTFGNIETKKFSKGFNPNERPPQQVSTNQEDHGSNGLQYLREDLYKHIFEPIPERIQDPQTKERTEQALGALD